MLWADLYRRINRALKPPPAIRTQLGVFKLFGFRSLLRFHVAIISRKLGFVTLALPCLALPTNRAYYVKVIIPQTSLKMSLLRPI